MDLERDISVLQKKISRLLVDTAKCLYENARKRPDKQYDSTSKFVGSVGAVPDEVIQKQVYSVYMFYDDKGFIYEDPEERKELLNHAFLYSVYNRSVKNTMTAMYWMRDNHKPHTIAKLYSPFEYCPIPILEQLCDVYPSVLEELKRLIPQKLNYTFGQQRKSQDEYLGKIREVLSNGSATIYKICDKYKEEQKRQATQIYSKATIEGRTETADPYYASQHMDEQMNPNSKYKDGFRILELDSNQDMIDHLYSLLQYSTRSMEFYNEQSSHGVGYGPWDQYYWNWRDNMAEVYIEAIECHWNMLRQLIPMRQELDSIAQKRQEEEKAIKNLRNNPLGNNFGLDSLFHIPKSKPKPKRRPRSNSLKRGPSPKRNSPKQKSPSKRNSPKQNSSMKQVPRISIESNRMRGPNPNRSRRPSASIKRPQPVKRSNGIGFGKSFKHPPRPQPARMYETNPNDPTPGTPLHAYIEASKGSQKSPPIRSRKHLSSNQPGTENNVLNLQEKYTRNHTGKIKKNQINKDLIIENL